MIDSDLIITRNGKGWRKPNHKVNVLLALLKIMDGNSSIFNHSSHNAAFLMVIGEDIIPGLWEY